MKYKFIKFINYLKNKVLDMMCLIILLLFLYYFYLLQLMMMDWYRMYMFCFVSFLILFYSWYIQHYSIIINQFMNVKMKSESKEMMYQWLCFYLQFNLYKNVMLYMLLQFDYLFMNKKDNMWVDSFFNIVVSHLILISVLYIILYYFYGMLYDLKKYNGMYKYLMFFSILMFTDIIYVFKLLMVLNSFKIIYFFLLCMGLFYDVINYVMFYFYYKPFKMNYENPVYSMYVMYKYSTLGTFTGLVTLSLYNNYKLMMDSDMLMDFNKLYFNNMIILYGNKDIDMM